MCILCFVHGKNLKFVRKHYQFSEFMPIKFQGHVKWAKVKYDDVISDCYQFPPLPNILEPQLSKTHCQIFIIGMIFITGS